MEIKKLKYIQNEGKLRQKDERGEGENITVKRIIFRQETSTTGLLPSLNRR
jgi:hypothetical protein